MQQFFDWFAVWLIIFTCTYYLIQEGVRAYLAYKFRSNVHPALMELNASLERLKDAVEEGEEGEEEAYESKFAVFEMSGEIFGMGYSLDQRVYDNINYYYLILDDGNDEIATFHWKAGDEDSIGQQIYNYAILYKENMHEGERTGAAGGNEPESSRSCSSKPQ